MRRSWFAALVVGSLLLQSSSANAQSVRPFIVETHGETRSRYELVNDTLFPMNVTLEARGFMVDEQGQPTFVPLPSWIHLRLSEMSFRIPPRQSHFVFYEARSDTLPAWFVIYATFSDSRRRDRDLDVQIELPHTVYLLQNEPLSESDVTISLTSWDPLARRGEVLLRNSGPRLGRVREARLIRKGADIPLEAFPLFPDTRRRVSFSWIGDEAPEQVAFDFTGFRAAIRLGVQPGSRDEESRLTAAPSDP